MSKKIIDTIILVSCVGIIFQIYEIRKIFLEINNNNDCHEEVGYYKCGGTRKNPKYCKINLEE